ncbi:MAG: Gfo/Idh/MocA family oxidoreductase [Pirellulaceae bacterium]
MRLRVGLIGLGEHWQTRHRPALLAMSDRFEVKAICCEIAKRSEDAAREFNAIAMDGFRAMMERDDIDAVLALSPDWVGPLPMIAACEAGKAVFSAAALDIIPEQIDTVRQRIDQSGVAFMAELPRRFAPATIRLKELMATRLGKPKLLFCHERLSAEAQTSRLKKGKNNPVSWRQLMEVIDWISYVVGATPSSVMSAIHEQHNENREAFYQMMNIEYPSQNGDETPVMAQLSVGHYIPKRWPDALAYRRPASMQICCENGMAFVDLPANVIWFDDAGQHTESLESERPVGERMLEYFFRSVTSLVRRSSDLNDSCKALQVVVAARESAISGQRHFLDFN